MVSRQVGLRVFAAVSIASLWTAGLPTALGAQANPRCNGEPATIVGTSGDDQIIGTEGPDVIVTRQGNDVIRGLGGDDIICSGQGDDEIFGGDGFDIIFAAQGNDVIYAAAGASTADRADSRGARMFGGAGDDVIYGSDRWDRMQGGLGEDMLFGFEGRDWIRAGGDADIVDGGPGIDDLHGGAGRDSILLTNGDSVRGGAGSDECTIERGSPARIISCERPSAGPAQPAAPAQPPAPAPVPGDSSAQFAVVACSTRGESVTVENTGDQPADLGGWALHDEGPNFTHTFESRVLGPGERLILDSGRDARSGPGQIIFADRDIWNNGGDTATLVRPNGTEVTGFACS